MQKSVAMARRAPAPLALALALALAAAPSHAAPGPASPPPSPPAAPHPAVPLYRLFELSVPNHAVKATDKMAGVWLNATFTSPAGATTDFWGFYDGDSTWRLRFMPAALGGWSFSWSFSDGSLSGKGSFECIQKGASPGVLRPYPSNPHWFAYNGERPVFLKSYCGFPPPPPPGPPPPPSSPLCPTSRADNKAGGSQRQDPAWFAEHFYSKLAARGYNHHMASGFLPVLPLSALWDGAPFSDPDAPKAINHTLYTDPASPQTSMSLDVWASLEGHLSVLNEHDISVQFFQGFNAQGPGGGGIQWSLMSEQTKRWWVAYVVARLAPFANLGGYQYAWESPGNNTATAVSDPKHCGQGSRCGDYQLATLLHEVGRDFNQLRFWILG